MQNSKMAESLVGVHTHTHTSLLENKRNKIKKYVQINST